MSKSKKINTVITFFVIVVFIEIFSAFTIKFLTKESLSLDYSDLYKKNNKLYFQEKNQHLADIYGDIFSHKSIQHPYFGFNYKVSEYNDINGFNGEIKTPHVKSDNEFIVGVFGGSYAQMFGDYILQKKKEDFKKLIRINENLSKEKEIKIINFAIPGGKQPQQFLISTFFLETIDYAVTIDGFNEHDNPYPRYPVSFPGGAEHYFRTEETREIFEEIDLIRLSKRLLNKISNNLFLKHSQTMFLVWHSITKVQYNRLIKLMNEIEKNYTTPSIYTNSLSQIENKVDLAVKNWVDFSSKQYDIYTTKRKKSFHILQPNQVIPNSKKFTENESKYFVLQNDLLLEHYSKLKIETEKLNSNGKRFFDATMIYQNIPDEVYIDSCCHVNDYGNEIMFEYIEKIITNK